MEKTELLAKLKHEREQLDSLFQRIENNGLANEVIERKWILKDVIAHLAYYENEVLTVLRSKSFIGNSFWKKPDDERNKEIFGKTNSKTLQETKSFATQTFNDLLSETESLTQEELNNSFEGTKRKTWDFIAGLTYGHYEEHIPKLKSRFNV